MSARANHALVVRRRPRIPGKKVQGPAPARAASAERPPRVQSHPAAALARPALSIAETRGYRPEDLDAIAQMAVQYLFNGGLSLAVTLFEGLVAVAPREPYYLMGLGLTYDRLDLRDGAKACYAAAGRVDPGDPRPDVNLAELALEGGDVTKARALLDRALRKATRRRDASLERKARALLDRLARRRHDEVVR